jgi:hypothetical protein
MTITWGRLHRRIHPHEQAPTTESDQHGLRTSEDVREKQKLRQALDAEIAQTDPRRPRPTDGNFGAVPWV